MRVNVYDHDLTGKVEQVSKPANDSKDGPVFRGVRFWLNPKIIHTEIGGEIDDDSPAVTFWHHEDDSNFKALLITSLAKALRLLGVDELPKPEEYAEEQVLYMKVADPRVKSPSQT